MLKKILACAIGLVVLFALSSEAVNPLIFTAINDTIQINPTPSNVPVKINGYVYVLPDTFTRVLGLKSFYNTNTEQFLLYNSDNSIIFDMINGTAADETGAKIAIGAIKRNGKVYLPAKAVCDEFGFEYSFVTISSLGAIVRINEERSPFDDNFFLEKNVETMKNLYTNYVKTYMNDETPPVVVPEVPPVVEPPAVTEPTRTVYISVKCDSVQGAYNMLEKLEGKSQKVTFFITEEVALNGELLREIYLKNHDIGILWSSNGGIEYINRVNSIIKGQIMLKTSLVLVENPKERTEEFKELLYSNGYKSFGYTYAPKGTSQRIAANTEAHIKKRTTSLILFGVGDEYAQAMPQLITYMRQNSYIINNLTIFD